jgi:hypothetical protein
MRNINLLRVLLVGFIAIGSIAVSDEGFAQSSGSQTPAQGSTAPVLQSPAVQSTSTQTSGASSARGLKPDSVSRKIDNDFVHQAFGSEFTYLPAMGAVFGDLDGDGVEDIAIAARCKNPMLDQAEHNFRVIDPLDSFYGYGNPSVTTTFSEGVPERRGLVVLIIHGAGKDAWRSDHPKAKYVIVNMPYQEISIRKLDISKKKTVDALYVKEAADTGESSAVFFDGKKFRYVPMGGDMQ